MYIVCYIILKKKATHLCTELSSLCWIAIVLEGFFRKIPLADYSAGSCVAKSIFTVFCSPLHESPSVFQAK